MNISQNKIEKIFSAFAGAKIIVLGDVMIDEYLRGSVNRLSPEAPVPVVDIEREEFKFGGAANVALNLKMLGCEPLLIGLIGNDRRGEAFLNLLNDFEISSSGIIVLEDRPTTVKTRIIGDNQHIARVDREQDHYLEAAAEEKILAKINMFIGAAEGLIIEDYNKGLLTKRIIAESIKLSNKKNIISTADPKFINFLEYKNITVFKPNIKETAQALAMRIKTDEDIIRAAQNLLEKLNAKAILLTQGEKGLSLIENTDQVIQIPAKTRQVADVSGAGDTVISAFTASLIGGSTFQEAALISNYAAGIVCEQVGIAPIYANQLLNSILKDTLE
jgi:rfaE bifunctional protein kinase chain/domain